MRIVFNILILLMIAMLLAGVAWQHHEQRAEQQRIDQTREEVNQFHRVISLHTALNNIERSMRGYPLTIDPAWFDEELPDNPLLDASHPWLEIAHEAHADLLHPPVRAASDHRYARFWYNPAHGIVRARVPRKASDAATLRLYNSVNGTNLMSLLPDPSVRRKMSSAADEETGETLDELSETVDASSEEEPR